MLPDDYGCVVANRFGNLLDDDADPFDLINDAEMEKEKKKKKEEQKKTKQKKSGQKETQKDRRVPFIDGQDPAGHKHQARGGPAVTDSRGGALDADRSLRRATLGERRAKQEDYPQESTLRERRAKQEDYPQEFTLRERRVKQEDYPQDFSVPKPSYNADFEPRGRGGVRAGRGGGGGAGGGGGGGYFQLRGKREYERHSGTGISPEEKRGGRGPWNWGSVQDTVGDVMDVTPEAAVKPDNTPGEGEEQASTVDGEVVVKVAMEMTFDEWKALQEMNRPKAEFNLRKAESTVPSKARVIHQSKKLEKPKSDALEEMEEEGHFLRRSVNDITSRLDINFGSLARPSRGGRGRGGRGGATSRPSRPEKACGTKSEKADDLAPNPDDPEDFPALTAGR